MAFRWLIEGDKPGFSFSAGRLEAAGSGGLNGVLVARRAGEESCAVKGLPSDLSETGRGCARLWPGFGGNSARVGGQAAQEIAEAAGVAQKFSRFYSMLARFWPTRWAVDPGASRARRRGSAHVMRWGLCTGRGNYPQATGFGRNGTVDKAGLRLEKIKEWREMMPNRASEVGKWMRFATPDRRKNPGIPGGKAVDDRWITSRAGRRSRSERGTALGRSDGPARAAQGGMETAGEHSAYGRRGLDMRALSTLRNRNNMLPMHEF